MKKLITGRVLEIVASEYCECTDEIMCSINDKMEVVCVACDRPKIFYSMPQIKIANNGQSS